MVLFSTFHHFFQRANVIQKSLLTNFRQGKEKGWIRNRIMIHRKRICNRIRIPIRRNEYVTGSWSVENKYVTGSWSVENECVTGSRSVENKYVTGSRSVENEYVTRTLKLKCTACICTLYGVNSIQCFDPGKSWLGILIPYRVVDAAEKKLFSRIIFRRSLSCLSGGWAGSVRGLISCPTFPSSKSLEWKYYFLVEIPFPLLNIFLFFARKTRAWSFSMQTKKLVRKKLTAYHTVFQIKLILKNRKSCFFFSQWRGGRGIVHCTVYNPGTVYCTDSGGRAKCTAYSTVYNSTHSWLVCTN